jgi:CheY-like chemotaxis protein
LSAVRQKDGWKRIEVRDTGIGMTASQLAQARQPFFQADSSSARRHGGTGLGLSIVERLVQAMGGRFELTSQRNRGTTARVFLPLPPAEPHVTDALSGRLLPHTGTALVVDVSSVARELIVEWLHGVGWKTVTAASGAEALSLAKQRAFDVVLLDFQMPKMDGGQVALKLRKQRTAKHADPAGTRVILVTANVFAREQLAAAHDAIDQVLVKPITRADLVSALYRTVERRSPRTVDDPRAADEINMATVNDLLSAPSSKAENLFEHLVPHTFREQAEALRELASALRVGDGPGVERAAHRVAGLASVVGATGVTTQARELMVEASKRSFRFDHGGRSLATLRQRWSRARSQLASMLRPEIARGR